MLSQHLRSDGSATYPRADASAVSTTGAPIAVEQDENNHKCDAHADMVARFSTGGIGHTVVFGGEYVKSYRFRTFARATLDHNPIIQDRIMV